jgi:raffinose/stachyose/melibiose transport system permease protein
LPTRKVDVQAYLYILPALGFYAVFVLWPILQTFWYSFHDWDGITLPTFTGLRNYLELAGDETFLVAIRNNLTFILFYTVLPIAFALLLTTLLTRRRLRGLTFFRAGLFLPQVMAMVVVGVAWRWIYHPLTGPLNQLLRAVGLEALARPWLGDFDLALPAVGLIATWVQYGFCMVLFIAGVQQIEEGLYDAARIDGAGDLQQFWHVTLPGLTGQIGVALVTTLIAALRIFDLVYVTTRGGPGNQTVVGALYLYRNAFGINRVGYGAAIAVVITLLILLISYAVLRFQSRQERAAL